MPAATRSEIEEYVRSVTCAPMAWVDVFVAAKLSLQAVDVAMQTMRRDVESPLRAAEDSLLSKEIVRINGVFGDLKRSADSSGRVVVQLNVMLTKGEAARVDAVVSNFCQVSNKCSRRFAHNGHSVCNAVRRACTGYLLSKFAWGVKIIEIGPDVKHWLTDTHTREWIVDDETRYVGARPAINRRDIVRMSWRMMAERIASNAGGYNSDAVVNRANQLISSYDSIFPNKRLEHLDARGDYIISNDAQYDFPFNAMPEVMVRVGARGWYGYMLRVKGLTRVTQLTEGVLPNTGVTYRVDWKKGRVVFRHPSCSAFAYTHDVWELMKYEERNGYVWHTDRSHYVYAKGPETNDEVLFFSVVRMVKAIYMTQPAFVDNPMAGRTRIRSVWAVGGWTGGVPTRFEPVVASVDSLAFGKVLERRIAQDAKGDLNQTMTLVKSVNVRMWLNGTPVGTNRRIETQLIEAVAVVVEVIAAEARSVGSFVFKEAMRQYKVSMQRQGWFMRLLESVVDMREICGKISGPLSRAWTTVRGTVIDAALSGLSDMVIAVEKEEAHLQLGDLCPQVHGACTGLVEKVVTGCVGPVDPDEFVEATLLDDGSSDETGSSGDSDDESLSSMSSVSPPSTVVAEEKVGQDWLSDANRDRVESKAIVEDIELTRFLKNALITETRVDATRLERSQCVSDVDVLQHCTTRTKHTLVRFSACRVVKTMGYPLDGMGAVYDGRSDKFHPVTYRGDVAIASVADGWYYTSNHLRVWNADMIIESLEYALSYGRVGSLRDSYSVTLGVFGAGKTYGMMRRIAKKYAETGMRFAVLSVTRKAANEAIEEGVSAGLSRKLLEGCVDTLDAYLINKKTQVDDLSIDEFPMAHTGRCDAAVSISGARTVNLYGDGRQIPFDPFTAAFDVKYGFYGATVNMDKVVFLDTTHRSPMDVCCAWLDMYPSIKPCSCCNQEWKERKSMEVVRVGTLADIPRPNVERVHVYTRADYEAVKEGLHIRGEPRVLKAMKNGGLATVHEDQGSSHRDVMCVRYTADYDKKASRRNPSLFNRPSYVLTDMTRHKHSYRYFTMSREEDMVVKRVACAGHAWRRSYVKQGRGMGLTTIEDMLNGTYHSDIVEGRTMHEDYLPFDVRGGRCQASVEEIEEDGDVGDSFA